MIFRWEGSLCQFLCFGFAWRHYSSARYCHTFTSVYGICFKSEEVHNDHSSGDKISGNGNQWLLSFPRKKLQSSIRWSENISTNRWSKKRVIKKPGDTENVSNYRPTSVFRVFSKILERIMYNRLYKHLKSNNLLFDKQFAILQLINNISTSFEKGGHTLGIFKSLRNSVQFFLAWVACFCVWRASMGCMGGVPLCVVS